MPSKSKKQHNLMAMCASDEGRKKVLWKCPPKATAQEFVDADRKRRGSRRKSRKK